MRTFGLSLTVVGYNSLIPLYWTSPVFKSNGVFFLATFAFGGRFGLIEALLESVHEIERCRLFFLRRHFNRLAVHLGLH